MPSKLRVALVHDHLAQDGGAERVLRAFMELYPEAPVFTLVYNKSEANPWFAKKDIRPSFIQHLPGSQHFYQWYLPFMPTAVERYDLTEFDIVLSSSASFAKGVITNPRTLHVCYLHSPTRYLWNDTISYVNNLRYARILKVVAMFVLTRLRQWDRLAADRVDHFIVNSRFVAERLKKYYRRDGQVIYPPVDIDRFAIQPTIGKYYLTGGRLVPYKRFDIVIEAFNRLGLPLKIFGTGPAEKPLRAIAKPNIEFVGRPDDEAMGKLFGEALAFINPQEEDFGITVIEAMAAGRPVIAYAAGGALETVKSGVTGTLFHDQEWEALADTVIRFKPEVFNPTTIRMWAEQFSSSRFQAEIQAAVEVAWKNHQSQVHS